MVIVTGTGSITHVGGCFLNISAMAHFSYSSSFLKKIDQNKTQVLLICPLKGSLSIMLDFSYLKESANSRIIPQTELRNN